MIAAIIVAILVVIVGIVVVVMCLKRKGGNLIGESPSINNSIKELPDFSF